MPEPRRFTVTYELQPRFRDTDAMGHINHAVFVTYLEVARQEYWRRLDGSQDYRDVPFILAHVSCDYRSEAMVSEVLGVGIRCEWIGTKSFAFTYQVWEQRSRRLVVEGESVQVCYDYQAKRSIAVPDGLRRALETLEGMNLSKAVQA